MIDWPFLILEPETKISTLNIAHFLLHPLFLFITLGLGYCLVDRKIWGRATLFVLTMLLLGTYIEDEWPIFQLPPEHTFAAFPKPIFPLSIVASYMAWIAWEYKQGVVKALALAIVIFYAYTFHQIVPLEWQSLLVTIIYVICMGGIFELISRLAKNYPQIAGLIISVCTIPLTMRMGSPTPLIYAFQGGLIGYTLGWILSGSESSTGKAFQLTNLFTIFTFAAGGILLWIILGLIYDKLSSYTAASLIGGILGIWVTAGVHYLMHFYSKK